MHTASPKGMTWPDIQILGARQHNLQDIDVSIPAGKITVITGRSGSGKSTLAIDVMFAEGQHRYLQSLGQDAASGLRLWDRPCVDSIDHLPPPVALHQKKPRSHHLSTVATLTGVKPLLRMLYATGGTPFCPCCRKPLHTMTIDQMVDVLMRQPEGTRLILMAPVTHLFQSMPFEEAVRTVQEQGFLRIIINGSLIYVDQAQEIPPEVTEAQLIVDRLVIKPGAGSRVTDSAQLALKAGNGILKAQIIQSTGNKQNKKRSILTFTERLLCTGCMRSFPDLKPVHFSMFEHCSPEQIEKQLPAGMNAGKMRDFISTVEVNGQRWDRLFQLTLSDLNTWLNSALDDIEKKTMRDVYGHQAAARRILEAVLSRIIPAVEMGLGYLGMDRPAGSLSTGELQRIRLGEQLSRSMSGVLYIMDEPTTGLHPSELQSLWRHIQRLRETGNTIVLIEHDTGFMEKADYLIELGPGAGEEGGHLIFSGPPEGMKQPGNATASGPWLSGSKNLSRKKIKAGMRGWIRFEGMKKNNLKDISPSVPTGCLTCITGVSGSGKSMLAAEIEAALLKTRGQAGRDKGSATAHVYSSDADIVPRPVMMDQTPVSGSFTSIPATYMGFFSYIRALFARTPEARKRGISAGWFSLAKKGGRCERCRGRGTLITDLKFLPPVESICDVCAGRRYNTDALSVTYKGKSMPDILDMTVSQAAGFFSKIASIRKPLEWIERTGLGYLKLGQPTSTLSGGEAQRIKLARELARRTGEQSVYILDEPTMGLHPEDVKHILTIFDDLLEKGHTVIVVEHDPPLIAVSDWAIELGPGGGPDGGNLIFEGTPEEMSEAENTATGSCIKTLL